MAKGNITIQLDIKAKEWFDEAAKCWIISNKEYNISGYGRTRGQAMTMFQVCCKDALKFKPK